jgi:hypothetical protein
MLFDLRGSGRRTTVKVVYLTLALLMGGGLVFFGIGGDVSGGLVDALTDRGSTGSVGTERFRDRAAEAQRRAQANPEDPAAWAALARARFQLASASDFLDPETGQFNDEGKAHLRAAGEAWERHLALDPPTPDDGVASLMVQTFSQSALNEPEKAVRAQEVITEERPAARPFASLAVLAYQAGQNRKGDLARKEALAMVDKEERAGLKAEIDAAKQQALTQAIQQNTPPDTGAATPETGGGGGGGGGGGNSGGGGSGGGGGGGSGGGGGGSGGGGSGN